MRLFVLICATGITLAVTGLAQESRWIRVSRTQDFALYVDSFRIEAAPDRRFGVWTKWEYSKNQTLVDKTFDTMVAHFIVDCGTTRLQQREATFSYADKVVLNLTTPTDMLEWLSAPPESINEALVVRSCLIADGKRTAPVK